MKCTKKTGQSAGAGEKGQDCATCFLFASCRVAGVDFEREGVESRRVESLLLCRSARIGGRGSVGGRGRRVSRLRVALLRGLFVHLLPFSPRMQNLSAFVHINIADDALATAIKLQWINPDCRDQISVLRIKKKANVLHVIM